MSTVSGVQATIGSTRRTAPPGSAPVVTASAIVLGLVGSALLVLAGSGWGGPRGWFGADTPLGATNVRPRLSHVTSVVGLGLVVLAWLGAGALVRAGRVGTRAVVAVATATALPLLAGPPLFSADARYYVAVGELVDTGGHPYTQGWSATGRPDYIGRASSFWSTKPCPYSPGAVRLLQGVAHVTGGDLDRGALVLRVLATAGVVTTGVLLVAVTRRTGGTPAAALWLGVGNPVVLLSGVSGAHLDAIVAPLALGAAACVLVRRPLLAGLLTGLAAQLKVTAFVLLAVVVAWAFLRDRSRTAARVAALASAATAVTFVAVSEACRLGWGWVHALSIPATANTSATPVAAAAELAHRAGLVGQVGTQSVPGPSGALQAVAMTVAAATCLTIVAVGRRVAVVEAAGWATLVVVLAAGAMWSWYLLVPLALIAVAPLRRGSWWTSAGLVVLSLVTLASARPGGGPSASALNARADLAFLLGYAAAVVLVLVGAVRGRTGRDRS